MQDLEIVLSTYGASKLRLTRVPSPSDNADPAVDAIRVRLPLFFESVVVGRGQPAGYKVAGSVGEYPLNMAAIPWVAAFRRDVTTGARKGYYVVLLFAEDGRTAALSLNQGFQDFLNEYKRNSAAERKARAVADFAGNLLPIPPGFKRGKIDLQATGTLGRGYQQCAILSRVYENVTALSEGEFTADLTAILTSYETLYAVAGRSLLSLLPPQSDEEFQAAVQVASNSETAPFITVGPHVKSEPVVRQGQVIYPRDPNVAARAIVNAGHACALADLASPHLSFIAQRTKRNYVEAHHLVPMSRQGEYTHSLDVEENIVALCPTCHRKAHLGMPSEKASILRRLLSLRAGGLSSRGIQADLPELTAFYGALAEGD